MATNSSIGHYPKMDMPQFYNSHLVSFQSEPLINSSAMGPMSLDAPSGINGTPGISFPASSNGGMRGSTLGMIPAECSSTMSNVAVAVPAGNSLCNVPVQDPMSTLAVEWTPYEQAILEDSLIRFAHVPGIMKYVKIAAFFNDKTVRDVALRCQWMCKTDSGKWRRQEDNSNWKKAIDRKEKVSHCTVQSNLLSSQNCSTHNYPPETIEREHKHGFLSEVADETICHLLDQNMQIFSQVANNQENFKLQENIDLLRRARNNIKRITNRMNEMPGVMGVMPSMPVALREDLANTILLGSRKNLAVAVTSITNQPKQEFYYG